MTFDRIAGPEAFLVEDVILALGNIRGMLGWVLSDKTSVEMQAVGLERLDRQIALLHERAEGLLRERADQVGSAVDARSDRPADNAMAVFRTSRIVGQH